MEVTGRIKLIGHVQDISSSFRKREVGIEGQMKIKQAKVLVIGAGGLGSPVLTYLSSCGVGTLAVVDFDTIEQHNLHRQILFTEEDINQTKTAVAYKRIKQINPHINFTVYNQKLKTIGFDDYALLGTIWKADQPLKQFELCQHYDQLHWQ